MGLYVKKVTRKFEQVGPRRSGPSRPVDVVIHEYGGAPVAAAAAAQLKPVPRMRTQLMNNVVEAFGP